MKEQTKCNNPPIFKYTWPGKCEDYVCSAHMMSLGYLVSQMGLYLEFIPLSPYDMVKYSCGQTVRTPYD